MSVRPAIVAVNTFREAVRDRVLYNLIFFALMMIGAAILVGQISIGIERLVIINLGLSAISIFGLVMAIFIGVGLVYKEIDKRTLYTLLAKPIRRWEFLVGKYAGLLLTLTVNTAFMTMALALALYYVGHPYVKSDFAILEAVYLILLELALVTALALLLLLLKSYAVDAVYTGNLCHGRLRAEYERHRRRNEKRAGEGSGASRLLSGAQFLQFQFHRSRGPWRDNSGLEDRGKYSLCRVVRLDCAAGFFSDICASEFEMSAAGQQRTAWAAALGVPLLFVATIAVQMRIDRHGANAQAEELLLTSPTTIKRLSLGYDALLGDIYWTRAVQYYGARVGLPGAKFDLLWPLLDIATALDPKLVIAYRFGAIFLSQPGSAGAGRADLAVKLVERGIAANPNEWALYSDLGFVQYWQLKDYPSAAATYLRGSKVPNAPLWLGMMAARIEQRGGSIETSRMIWSEIYQSTKVPEIRKKALAMLEGLKAEQDQEQLSALAGQYKARFGHNPNSMRQLIDAGLIGSLPVDPEGYPYRLNSAARIELDPKSPIVIPEAPPAPPGASK